jgi:hypothetical protein
MWQFAVLDDWGYRPDHEVIFFEDDVVLCANFKVELDLLFDDLDRDFPEWDLVFLGTCGTEPGIWNKVTDRIGGPNSRLCTLVNPFGTHAMMIRRRAIPVLLEHMRAAERNLDQQLWQRVLQPGHLKWCAVLPSLVHQRTYDNAGVGSPEWKPSTLRPGEEPPEPVEAHDDLVGDLPGRPSAETLALTLSAIDPTPCIFRGEMMEEHGRSHRTGKSVPLSECARLNTPCHAKKVEGPVIGPTGQPSVACESCPLRLEMAPSRNRDRLDLPDGHFNPSMIKWNGAVILATRDSWGHAKVALWDLQPRDPAWLEGFDIVPIGSFGSTHKLAPRLEDPRLFIAPYQGKDHLHASFSLPDGYPPKVVKVGYVRFALDLSGIEETIVMDSPHGNLYEKNWMPLVDEGEIRWVYSGKPNHVVLGGTQNWSTPNPFPWTGGALRGGATPVLTRLHADGADGPVYVHFFHGCLKRAQGSVYTIGCNVFEAKPPYRILRQTPTPLVWPDLPAADESVVKRFVLFPGGAIPHAGAWHIACGVDDCACRIIQIPFAKVEAALKDVPEERQVSSIRDTHIALGVKKEDFT